MPTALVKQPGTRLTISETRKRESVSSPRPTSSLQMRSNVVDLVKVLQQSLKKKASASRRTPKRVAESAVQKLKDEVAALFGQQYVVAHQRFLVEIAFEGEKIRLRKPASSFPSTRVRVKYLDRTPADMLHAMKSAEGGAWTGDELQTQFDLTPATLHRRRKENRMVYWRDAKHQFHYPKWQFTESGALIPGLQEVLAAFKSTDEWRLMRYFLAPRHELGDRSPLTLLQEGKKNDVIAHAKANAEENTW